MNPSAGFDEVLAVEVAHVEGLLTRLNRAPEGTHSQVRILIALVSELHADGIRRLGSLPRRKPNA